MYLNYLLGAATGLQFRTMPESFEDESFKRVSKEVNEFVKSGQYVESIGYFR